MINEAQTTWRHRQDQEVLIWSDLCEVARRLGFEVRQERLTVEARVEGGLVRVGEQRFFLVEDRLPQTRKNQILAETLRGCGIQNVYTPPYLREWLEPHSAEWSGMPRKFVVLGEEDRKRDHGTREEYLPIVYSRTPDT